MMKCDLCDHVVRLLRNAGPAGLACVAIACGDDAVGLHHGRTSIQLSLSESDDHPYQEERADSVRVRSAGDHYRVEWLGCEFRAKKVSEAGDDLEATTCTLELEDGRKVNLVIGHVDPYLEDGTTLTTFSASGDTFAIDVVASVTIEGIHYRPCYFRFDAD